MNQIKRDIVNEVLKKHPNYNNFETEHFIYWILSESYVYDGNNVSREEFEYIKKYAVHHGTLPSIERNRSMLSKEKLDSYMEQFNNGYKNSDLPEFKQNTYSNQTILRYSKTYDSLELYRFNINVRATFQNNSLRVLLMKKITKIFSVNSKGYVRINRNRWLSLKNCQMFCNQIPEVRDNVIKHLLVSMIGKDWVKDFCDDWILISNKNARRANSIFDAIDLECGATPAKVLCKFFGDDTNSLIALYKLVEPNKIHDITNFIIKNKRELVKLYDKISESKTKFLLFCYFISKDNRCEKQLLFDYFQMALENEVKINVKISSYSTLKRNHDELSRKILLKSSTKGQSLRVKKIFPNIKSISGLDVKKINTVQRLNAESAELHHCVHSYKRQINEGSCCIYSLIYEGKPYTLQVGGKLVRKESEANHQDEDYYVELTLSQLKGKYNSNPPESIKPLIHKICQENDIKPESINNLYFMDKKKDKRKVVQIGSKILERIEWTGNASLIYEDDSVPDLVKY